MHKSDEVSVVWEKLNLIDTPPEELRSLKKCTTMARHFYQKLSRKDRSSTKTKVKRRLINTTTHILRELSQFKLPHLSVTKLKIRKRKGGGAKRKNCDKTGEITFALFFDHSRQLAKLLSTNSQP